MNRIYLNYQRKKFRDWKDRVKKYLPSVVTQFYAIKGHIDYDKHKLLGFVILGINDPYYGFTHNGKQVDYSSEMAAEVMLEIQVNELFGFVARNYKN